MSKESIIRATEELVREIGAVNVTRQAVCERAGVPDGSYPSIMECTHTEYMNAHFANSVMPDNITKKRISSDNRKNHLVRKAVELSRVLGYTKLTRVELANGANVSEGLVSHYFGTMNQLRRAIMRAAIKLEVAEVVAQGLAIKDPQAKKAPDALKQLAAASLVA